MMFIIEKEEDFFKNTYFSLLFVEAVAVVMMEGSSFFWVSALTCGRRGKINFSFKVKKRIYMILIEKNVNVCM